MSEPSDSPAPSGQAQETASRAAARMWAEDRASQALGMALEEVGPGRARLSMTVTETMVNGHNIGHGGLTFSLADSAFAFACNSHGPVTVAQHCEITFTAPARLGDRLTAQAEERWRRGRQGLYDVTVTNQNNEVIAEFRGLSRTIEPKPADR